MVAFVWKCNLKSGKQTRNILEKCTVQKEALQHTWDKKLDILRVCGKLEAIYNLVTIQFLSQFVFYLFAVFTIEKANNNVISLRKCTTFFWLNVTRASKQKLRKKIEENPVMNDDRYKQRTLLFATSSSQFIRKCGLNSTDCVIVHVCVCTRVSVSIHSQSTVYLGW